ncbi:hypothetical protein GCM10010512_09460 [Streptomyces thermoviolaceus subsp. thermoviolaceus]|nr:hypothetical protein GCM10010512_09460 [Streptomyces thermoviolaceus subsp. thermoviolaceus]
MRCHGTRETKTARATRADTAKAAAQGIGGRRLHDCREVAPSRQTARPGTRKRLRYYAPSHPPRRPREGTDPHPGRPPPATRVIPHRPAGLRPGIVGDPAHVGRFTPDGAVCAVRGGGGTVAGAGCARDRGRERRAAGGAAHADARCDRPGVGRPRTS